MITIENVLDAPQVANIMRSLDEGEFVDGNRTTANARGTLKNNLELAPDKRREQLGKMVLQAVQANTQIADWAYPSRFSFPMFSRYEEGMYYDFHTDAAIINLGRPTAVRTDISCTIFLSDPDSYDGGELIIEAHGGSTSRVKLAAGHAALYPTSDLHRVETVTRGARVASVFWIQSYLRDDVKRGVVCKLNRLSQSLVEQGVPARERNLASSAMHDLLRMWSD